MAMVFAAPSAGVQRVAGPVSGHSRAPFPAPHRMAIIASSAVLAAVRPSTSRANWRSDWRSVLDSDPAPSETIPSGSSDDDEDDEDAYASNRGYRAPSNLGGSDDEDAPAENGFFTSAFKEALQGALERSPLYKARENGSAASAASPAPASFSVPDPSPSRFASIHAESNGNGAYAYGGHNSSSDEDESDSAATAAALIAQNAAFSAALKDALARSKESRMAIRPRGMDDDDGAPGPQAYDPLFSPARVAPRAVDTEPRARATPYVPEKPKARELSELGEVLSQAWSTCRSNVQRLNRLKAEIESAIDREAAQMERLEFALEKAENDAAYHRTVEKQLRDLKAQMNGNGARR